MKLLTAYLPRKVRSAVRFFFVGTSGAIVQTWFFVVALYCFGEPEKGSLLYYVAFGIGYFFEMLPNYILSNWYTFGTRPSKKNAGGFIFARIINLLLQFGILPFVVCWLPHWRDDFISILVIFIAGIVNYLICTFFFKDNTIKKKRTKVQS